MLIYVLHGKELYFQNPEKKSILQSFLGKTRRNAKTLISIHFCVHINWCCWWRQWNCQSNCGLKMTWDWWKMALLLSTCQLYFLQVQLLLVNTYRKGNHRHRKSHPDILRQGKLDLDWSWVPVFKGKSWNIHRWYFIVFWPYTFCGAILDSGFIASLIKRQSWDINLWKRKKCSVNMNSSVGLFYL